MTSHVDILQSIMRAWGRKDIDAVLTHMDDDIVWHVAASAVPPVIGKPAAREFLERFGANITEIRWRIFHVAESVDRLFLEGVDEYTTNEGITVAAPYAGVLEFRDNLVIGWRDYVDTGVINDQKAGKLMSAEVKLLLGRKAIF